MIYRTLSVRIEALYEDRYRAIVRGIGDGHAEFELSFDDSELDALADAVSRPRSARRRIETDGSARARAFGQQLFDMVFNDSARDVIRDSLSQARHEDHGLRIMLQVDGAGRLRNVPWELLWNAPGFVSMSAYTPIVRYAKAPTRPQPLGLSPPLRILGMVSSPSDMPALDADREQDQLAEGCRSLIERGLLQIDWVAEATLGGLLNRLNEGDYHIFHFIGHGDFDEQAEDGVLLLEGRAGKSHRLTGADLGAILADQHKLRLAVVNACEGARVSTDSSGVAASLIQYGLPAVIAMQFEISDEAAISFARHFYGSIARGHPIDKALMDARRGMFADEQGLEWATPVLFTSVDDGRLFEVGLKAGDLDGPVSRPVVGDKREDENRDEPDTAPELRGEPPGEPHPRPQPHPEPMDGVEGGPVGTLGEGGGNDGGGVAVGPRTVAILGVALVPILIVVLALAGVFSGGSSLKYGEPIHVDEVPVGVALAADRVWVPNQNSEEVTSIDPHTGVPNEPIPIGGKPNSIAVDLQTGYIWVVSIDNGLVTVLDPGGGSGKVRTVRRFTLEGKPNAIVLGFGEAWVTDPENGTVNEIDERSVIEGGKPDINAIEGVGDHLSGIAVGRHYVWVSSAGNAGVIRMTPHDGGYIQVPVKFRVSGIAVQVGKTGEEAVWISNLRGQSVSRIVPNEESGEVAGSPIYVGREPKGIAATPEGIWVASAGSGRVSWIAVTPSGDRKQDQDRSISLPGQPNAVAVGLNAVWVANIQTSSVTPLTP